MFHQEAAQIVCKRLFCEDSFGLCHQTHWKRLKKNKQGKLVYFFLVLRPVQHKLTGMNGSSREVKAETPISHQISPLSLKRRSEWKQASDVSSWVLLASAATFIPLNLHVQLQTFFPSVFFIWLQMHFALINCSFLKTLLQASAPDQHAQNINPVVTTTLSHVSVQCSRLLLDSFVVWMTL